MAHLHTVHIENKKKKNNFVTQEAKYTECWPCPPFDILLNKCFSCWQARWQVEDPSMMLVQSSKECTPPYLSTGISNPLQQAQAEVVLGQLSAYLAS
jgi:hypothetical protein